MVKRHVKDAELRAGDKVRYGPKNAPERQKTGYIHGFTAYRDEPAYVVQELLTGELDWPIFIGEIWKEELFRAIDLKASLPKGEK